MVVARRNDDFDGPPPAREQPALDQQTLLSCEANRGKRAGVSDHHPYPGHQDDVADLSVFSNASAAAVMPR